MHRSNTISRDLFISIVDKWAVAAAEGRTDAARFQAREMATIGQMLALHPDFQRVFQQLCPEVESDMLIKCLGAFFSTVTEMPATSNSHTA